LEANLAGRDHDEASVPDRQAAGHHGGRIADVASQGVSGLDPVRLDHGTALVIPPVPAAGGGHEDRERLQPWPAPNATYFETIWGVFVSGAAQAVRFSDWNTGRLAPCRCKVSGRQQ
jgi:hypothetical protein